MCVTFWSCDTRGQYFQNESRNVFLVVHLAYSVLHIIFLQGEMGLGSYGLSKAKHFLDHKSLHILYSSMIIPYLNYCAEIWASTYKCTLQPLSTLQKRAIGIIHNTGYREHTNPLFLKAKTLKLTDLVHFQTAQIMYSNKQPAPRKY